MKYPLVIILGSIIGIPVLSFSQSQDSINHNLNVSGSVTVTNNGISIIPTFSLGKPAAIFDLSVGKRLSFDPEFMFSMQGKPWTFLFWGRYKLVNTEKFHLNAGAHLALSFLDLPISTNAASNESIVAERFLVGVLSPSYSLSKKVLIGIYYLYGHGFDNIEVRTTNYLTLYFHFSDIKISKQYYLVFEPQFYYLRINNNNGCNFTTDLTLSKKNFPFSVSGFMNKEIYHIPGGKNLLWNVSLIYSFSNRYKKI